MHTLEAALSALRTSQQALQTIGNNIANANTPGYHRQRVELVDRRPAISGGLSIGQGVDIAQIRRMRNAAIEASLLQTTASQGRNRAELETLRHIESLLTRGEGSLNAQLQDFFNQWELLAAEPAEGVRRLEVLQSAAAVAEGINALSGGVADLKRGLWTEIAAAVEEVNRLSEAAATLNREIQLVEARGVTPNDLFDQRDQLVTQLAELLDAELVDAGATKGIRLANGESIITTTAQQFSVTTDGQGNVLLTVGASSEPVQLMSGRLAGLIEGHNVLVQDVDDRINELASGLVQAVNTIHASGLGADGNLTLLGSTRAVMPTDVPFHQAAADFPITGGELSIGVTDTSTGIRTLHRVVVDPAADSLNDLSAALSGIAGITSSVDAQSGRLAIAADAGHTFDLTGALPSQATVVAATGTSIPTFSGQYLGGENETWTLTVGGSGEVGTSAGLTLEVRDQNGAPIDSLIVGAGYARGDPLELPNGVILHVPAGTLNDGDTFQVTLVAEADTAGVLAALGAFGLFTGTRPGTLAVNPLLLNDSRRLSISQSGDAGDNWIATRMAALGQQTSLAGGTATFTEFLSQASAESGVLVHAESERTALSQLAGHFFAERESISGVNTDEELVRMLEFQRMFQTSARFLTSVNETFDEVLALIR